MTKRTNLARRLGIVPLAAAVVFALMSLKPVQAEVEEVTMMTWGGLWLDIFRPVAEQFEEETGIRVNFVVQSGASDGLNKLMAQRANPQVDVWTSIESTVQAATAADLLLELDREAIPALAEIPDELIRDTGVSIWLTPRGIFYRKDLVPFEPTEWEDLWDPRLEGRIGVSFALDRGNFLVMAALINGGSEHDIEPGWEALNRLRPNIHAIYTSDPESIRLLETEEIAVAGWGILPNVYRRLGPDSEYRFVMPSEPRFLAWIPISIVKGRSEAHTRAAERLVDYFLQAESQAQLVEIAGTIPSNPQAPIPELLREILPPLPLTGVYNIDWDVVNKNYEQWEERWMREIQRR